MNLLKNEMLFINVNAPVIQIVCQIVLHVFNCNICFDHLFNAPLMLRNESRYESNSSLQQVPIFFHVQLNIYSPSNKLLYNRMFEEKY